MTELIARVPLPAGADMLEVVLPSTGCPHLAQTVVSVIGNGGRRSRLRWPGRGRRSPAQA